MKSRKTRSMAGILLVGAGFLLASLKPDREKTYLLPAGGCKLETTIFDKKDAAPQGTVVLFPGLVANKKVMAFLAGGFAEQNLRVYVPDLPGHGHSPGPFSPQRAEDCAEALVSGLVSRGLANPGRTILAGHSMGAAIALPFGAPYIPFRLFVPHCQELVDRFDQFAYAFETPLPYTVLSQVREEALHQVHPGTACRREVQDDARMSLQPVAHFFVFVRCIVVYDQVQLQL